MSPKTVVLGNTGADKSTFVQWLAGDNTKLISELAPGSASEFVIRDETNSTIKLMLPSFVIGHKTGDYYFDWPEFSDRPSTNEYISSPYFIKLESGYFAERVRFLFVIGYPAVKVGLDHCEFIEFLKHSTFLVKNVDKFRQSIAIVVTKVDNTFHRDVNGKIAYTTDEEIIDSIANFMKNVREDLKRNDTKANENYVKFIDALLQRDGQAYSRIAIFRRPDMAGPLSEIPLLVKGKAKLVEMVNQLKFVSFEKNDLGYSISDISKSATQNSTKLQPTSLYDKQRVSILLSRYSAADKMSVDGLHWHFFLQSVISKFGEYQFQHEPSRYNVANLEDWGKGQTKPQNIHIDEQNLSQFVNILSQHNVSGLAALQNNTQIAQWQLDDLNQVLSLTLKNGKAKTDCTEDGKLVVTGDFVKLSNLKPKLVKMCPSKINSVNIYASHTVFIDSDLDGLGDNLKLTIMAPKWEVVGLRRINLDGYSGQSPQPNEARISDHSGIISAKGKPGLSVGNPGSFLGVAQQFVNREGLTITAKGSAGGIAENQGMIQLYNLNGSTNKQKITTKQGNDLDAHCEFYSGFVRGTAHPNDVIDPEAVSLNLYPAINEYKTYLASKLNEVKDRFKRLSAILDQVEKNDFCASSPRETPKVDKVPSVKLSTEPSYIYDVDGFLYHAQNIINLFNSLRENGFVQRHLANNLIIHSKNSAKFNGFVELLSSETIQEMIVHSDIVPQQYDSVVEALELFVFPYVHYYLDEGGFKRNSTDFHYLLSNAVASLNKMRSRVIENRSSIWRVDRFARETLFDSTHSVTSPFYVWSKNENKDAIAKLLSGESITLNADIRLSDSNKDAIKFNRVAINLKAKNCTVQAEIDAELNNFMITATHKGNSHYRYADKYYLINTIPLKIQHSFAKDSNGLPINSNYVYNKIASGELMLSPYAKWQIQLTKMNETVTFDQLAKYRDDVDLELVGQGIYTESQRARSDYLQVERYYSEYIDRAQSNVTEGQQLNSAKVMKVSNSLHRSEDSVLNQASNSTGSLLHNSRQSRSVSNLFSSSVNTHHIAHPRFDYTRQHSDTNNSTNLTRSSNSVDVHGNLLMGQLLVGLIAGKNNTIANESYISPEQTRVVQVDSLAQRVVPVLSSATKSTQHHNSNNQWYRDWNDTSRDHN